MKKITNFKVFVASWVLGALMLGALMLGASYYTDGMTGTMLALGAVVMASNSLVYYTAHKKDRAVGK